MSYRLTSDHLDAFLADYKMMCLKHGMVIGSSESVELFLLANAHDPERLLERCVRDVRMDGEYTIKGYERRESPEIEQENLIQHRQLKEGAD